MRATTKAPEAPKGFDWRPFDWSKLFPKFPVWTRPEVAPPPAWTRRTAPAVTLAPVPAWR